MSEATLKKKTAHLYNAQSTKFQNFALNGVRRPQGYIGQTAVPGDNPRTLARGNTFRGNGGNFGRFNRGIVKNGITSGLVDFNRPQVIKGSVINTMGMLMERDFRINAGNKTNQPLAAQT